MYGEQCTQRVLALLVPLLVTSVWASAQEIAAQGTAQEQEEMAVEATAELNRLPGRIAEEKVQGERRESAWAGRKPEDQESADAVLLALRILQRESNDLLPNKARLAALSIELAEVLSRLKKTYPAFARFRVRPSSPGELLVGLDYEFALIVQDALSGSPQDAQGERAAILRTGHKAFDELNDKMGLRHIDLWGIEWKSVTARLHLHEHANLRAAVRAYSALDVVDSAEPNQHLIDGPDIDVMPTAEGWLVSIRNAWGDCPSGCIHEEVFHFMATRETVQRVNREGSFESPTLEDW